MRSRNIALLLVPLAVLLAGSAEGQWQPNGVVICAAADTQDEFAMIADGDGGAIITWRDARGGSVTQIYAQRLDQ